MALTITTSVNKGPAFVGSLAKIQARLKTASKDVSPVVTHFAASFRASITKDFREGGRPPYKWAKNKPNTIAAKGNARPLIGKSGKAKLDEATRIVSTYAPPTRYQLNVLIPEVGAFHMTGWKGGVIRPKRAKALRFPVAEQHANFLTRRRSALKRRREGNTQVKVPSRAKVLWVYAREVRHPGYPARRFVVLRESLIARHFRRPMRDFLVDGKLPGPPGPGGEA